MEIIPNYKTHTDLNVAGLIISWLERKEHKSFFDNDHANYTQAQICLIVSNKNGHIIETKKYFQECPLNSWPSPQPKITQANIN